MSRSRAPIYCEKDNKYRICSLPNDQWQYQRAAGVPGNRDEDHWHALARATDFATAKRQLDTRHGDNR